ncbi:MAG TPA: hypothetical protein VMU19_11355 [Bryobacteraceae bacterium]|nr:hypothetical protein [Bryobacteraceae bacterium]
MSATHEDLERRPLRRGPSDRNFGLVFTAILLVYALAPARRGQAIRPAGLAFAAALGVISFLRPVWLSAPNRLWTKLAECLARIVNPVAMAVLFFTVFTPAAVILRWMGKDILSLAIDRRAATYWIPRAAEPRPDMTRQF